MKAMSQTRRLGEPPPPPKVWRLGQASIQASAHRTSHDGLEIDAMCCTSQVGGGIGGPFAAQVRGFCQTEINFTSNSLQYASNSNTKVMKCTLCSALVGPTQEKSKQLSFYFTTVELAIIPSLPNSFLVGFRMKCR